MLIKARWLLLVGLFLGLHTNTRLYSQNITKSPYSIIGIGDLIFSGNAANYAMGQVTQGKRNPYNINFLNPASYSGLLITNIEAGATYSQGHFKGSDQTNDVNNAWIGYLNFAFPVSPKKGIGISFGATPYSGVGYNIRSSVNIPSDSAAIPAIYYFTGNGGLSRFYAGYGMRIHKKQPKTISAFDSVYRFHVSSWLPDISLGGNANYLFGQIKNTTQLLIPAQYKLFNTNEDKVNYIHGWSYDIGVQVHDTFTTVNEIKNKHSNTEWVLGATITPAGNLAVEQDYILRTLPVGSSAGIKDTVFQNSNLTGNAVAPLSWKVGFNITQKTRRQNNAKQTILNEWQLAGDVRGTNWSSYRNLGLNDSLRNSLGISIGASYIPDLTDAHNMLKRIEYRAGCRFEQSNLEVNGTGVNVWAVTAGFGIPLPKSKSKLNLGFEYMVRGTVNNGLIQENYFRGIIGISFADKWFHRYRYD
ncbi:MAG: hypothetical protein H7296_14515 [Bacteroidia bacterium]|nr:hypothetical protein [Bacteroidia bacterium]